MGEKTDCFVVPSDAKFPGFVSSTAVELLMKNPYTFYAKNVLKLKKLDRFKTSPNSADFGIFIHYVLDQYTKNYSCGSLQEKVLNFVLIAKKVLEKMNFQKQSFWIHKIESIAQEFVDFDEERRSCLIGVWSEQKGSAPVKLASRNIVLTSIADRIELSKSGEVYIVDYKTGLIPSKQEVQTGLSPQLLVSCIIASRGGFDCIKNAIIPAKITYVKLSSCSPYWQASDIIVHNLDEHLKQLMLLLELFVENGTELKFSPSGNRYNGYDEYAHLSRNI
jgi:ATP-dependent helicase/nuclease subunit B